MRARVTITFVLAVTMLAGAADARQRYLRGEVLLQFLSGSTLYIATPLGSLPIVYRSDGTMTGRSKRLARYTGSVQDEGSWWVKRSKLCQRWNRWEGGRRQCFTLRSKGNKIFWRRTDGEEGTARIARR